MIAEETVRDLRIGLPLLVKENACCAVLAPKCSGVCGTIGENSSVCLGEPAGAGPESGRHMRGESASQ
jgi:hypothetical protein